ncbi:MAG: hypothetical protein HY238_10150 [Acidobacteria bacterium]|nr:hypothetical protein [Acidobacteriota bacterium]
MTPPPAPPRTGTRPPRSWRRPSTPPAPIFWPSPPRRATPRPKKPAAASAPSISPAAPSTRKSTPPFAAPGSTRSTSCCFDSTLRGPWIDEVDELLLTTDYSQAIVCPAFPAQGRTVHGGWLWLHGQRVQQILCPFTVRDAETEDDLARVAADICSSILPVGSAGLALHVFPRVPASPRLPVSPLSSLVSPLSSLLSPQSAPWLVLVASEHPASRAQLHLLREAALPGVLINPDSCPATLAGVFATGGETAARFLRGVEARGITELRELLPGIPAGRILGARYNGTVMITKAGGFGDSDAIVRAIQFFL